MIKVSPSLVKQSLEEKIAERLNLKIVQNNVNMDTIRKRNWSMDVSHNYYTHLTPNREFDNFNFPKAQQIKVKEVKKYYEKIKEF